MKSKRNCIISICWVILLLSIGATTLAQDTPPDFEAIDAFVASQVEDLNLPGLAFGIVHGDQIVHLQSFGAADPSGRAITPQTPFLLASLTKSFTALAIMQLVEAGQVELDAPVQQYLPWFHVADSEASAQITLRHLLNQTSGLSTLTGNSVLPTWDASQPDPEAFVRSLSSATLASPPGESSQYSNANYAILGIVIETVSGETYAQYIQQHIFAPLEMHNSFLSEQEARQHGMAAGHQFRFGRAVPVDMFFPEAFEAAGGIVSSSEDMSHYLIAYLNQGRYGDVSLLSPAGVAQMWQPPASSPVDENSSYGMGWFVGAPYNLPGNDHSGGGGDFHTHMVVTPNTGWGVVVLVNAEHLLLLARPVEYIAWGVINMLHGQTVFANTDISRALYLGTFVITALQLLSLIWGLFRLRHWMRQLQRRPQGVRQVALRVVLPILLNLSAAYVFVVAMPQLVGLPFAAVLAYIPDWGSGFLLSGVVAAGWLLWGIVAFFRLRRLRTPLPQTIGGLQADTRQTIR